jgi:hypothetical protein
MNRTSSAALALAGGLFVMPAWADGSGLGIAYTPGSLIEARIGFGPWTLHESGEVFAHDASGIVPTGSGPPYSGSGTPYADYCSGGHLSVNHGLSLMQPYYFPFVRRRFGILEGFFDYRPRNEQEATVEAISFDWGADWFFLSERLALNPYCPWDATDPDNLNVNVNVNGAETAYGSSSANAADNGQGHPTVLAVKDAQYVYTLNRANGHIDSDELVVHKLTPSLAGPLGGLPDYGFVSPLASGGYPTLDSKALSTVGLQRTVTVGGTTYTVGPDAEMGAVAFGDTTALVYVEKQLNLDMAYGYPVCPKTPDWALTNLVNGKARKPNHDVTTVRVATTTDGIHYTQVGAATGLNDPTTTAPNGIRYLGSGSIIKLADGRYGMFFGAGNCLDNDSDGFHFIGYAETTSPVRTANDLLSWTIVNALDNPILSTDTVTDPSGPRPYPLNAPIVNVTGADALTAAQVAPFTPPAPGYNTNFFSGRVYDPQALYTDPQTVTIVFAGYNTPQPSNNLGDYRTIGRFQLRFPTGYVAPY